MTLKEITYEQLKKAIDVAFKEDTKIFSLYDPGVEVKTIEDIVNNISKKVETYPGCIVKGVFIKDELIGYIVHNENALISFSISVKYRTRKFLREFFSCIKSEFSKKFICFLWNRNQRAIKWLQKNDMKIVGMNDKVTQLAYN